MERLIKPAKDFMIAYFRDGKVRQPTDFDSDILGGTDTQFLVSGRPKWNSTPFCIALGELVKEGVIEFEERGDEGFFYWMKK